jgi:hypothetical protein
MPSDDDALCWLCDGPLTADRPATSWHGFGVGAHRDCARQGAGPALCGRDAGGRATSVAG